MEPPLDIRIDASLLQWIGGGLHTGRVCSEVNDLGSQIDRGIKYTTRKVLSSSRYIQYHISEND